MKSNSDINTVEFFLNKTFESAFKNLFKYVEDAQFKGWDPYDGLNSKLFQATPLKNWSLARLIWIQLFKLNPYNLREFVGIKKDFNPKGLALFISGYCNLQLVNSGKDYSSQIIFLTDKLIELQSKGYSGACWGYNFDWQNRVFYQPRYTPTVVATSFAANALFESYDITDNKKYLEVALSSVNFILKDLNRTQKGNELIFSYSPLDHSKVYNASLLGARLLARAYSYKNNHEWLKLSQMAVKTIVKKQNIDGSWIYGEADVQNWIDSFHTGFNLECIHDYMKYSGDHSFENELISGLKYYIENFILEDGTPKYYHDKIFPLDIHAPAQFIVTIIKLNQVERYKKTIEKVLHWVIEKMQDKRGFFYYQIKKYSTSKIPYMRWAQAWMFYAFCEYYKAICYENLDRSN